MNKLLSIVFLLYTLTSFSQRPGGNGMTIGSISGKVIDPSTKKGMEYVTIAIFKQDKIVTGATSDAKGEFVIEKIELGSYVVKCSFIGYNSYQDTIDLTKEKPAIDLGNITLKVTGEMLGEVEINADQPLVKYEIDKKVVDVSNMENAASQTAVEVLENVPSINVDIDGNISLRGSSSFTLLIDNKPTTMEISDALKMIPANSIQEIEIITNPSARYDAEGVSGIINIILKKNKLEGISALINGNVSSFPHNEGVFNYGGDFLVNINKKNLSITLGGNYRTNERPQDIHSIQQTTYGNDISLIDYKGKMSRNFGGWGTNTDLEWRPNRKSIITLTGTLGGRKFNSGSDLFIEESLNDTLINSFHNLEDAKRNFINYSMSTSYKYHIQGDKNTYFMFRGMYQSFNGNEYTVTEYFDDENQQQGGNINTEVGPSNMARFNLDYVKTFKSGNKFEIGGQSQFGISGDITETFQYDTTVADYIETLLFNTTVDYFRNIHAGYVIYSGKLQKLGYQLGFRGEYTDRTITSTAVSSTNKVKRFDPFPSAHFTYQADKKNQFMANVSRRIERPRSWYFEPFITWQNAYSVRTGNAALIPEYIYAYELGYTHNMKKGNFSVELYHRNVVNKIQRVRTVYTANVIMTKPENIGSENSTGSELSFSYPIKKWWKSDISGNLYLYRVVGSLGDQNFDNESFSYNGRWNNTFSLKNDWKVQLTGKYNSAVVTAQGSESDNYSLDASVKKNLSEGKYSVSLQMRDVFSTTRTITINESPGFYGWKRRDPRTPVITLAVSVKFNNYNKRASRPESNDEF